MTGSPRKRENGGHTNDYIDTKTICGHVTNVDTLQPLSFFNICLKSLDQSLKQDPHGDNAIVVKEIGLASSIIITLFGEGMKCN